MPHAATTLDDLNAQHAKVLEGIRQACAGGAMVVTDDEMSSAAWAVVNHAFGWRTFRFWAAEDPTGGKGWAMSRYAKWLAAPVPAICAEAA